MAPRIPFYPSFWCAIDDQILLIHFFFAFPMFPPLFHYCNLKPHLLSLDLIGISISSLKLSQRVFSLYPQGTLAKEHILLNYLYVLGIPPFTVGNQHSIVRHMIRLWSHSISCHIKWNKSDEKKSPILSQITWSFLSDPLRVISFF